MFASRTLMAIAGAAAAVFASAGMSHAGLDNELGLIDGQARTLLIQQWDTTLNGVFPLDRNPLTREWFHSGKAVYRVAGVGADDFQGTLELGYQMGFPWALALDINFSYRTPNITFGGWGIDENLADSVFTPPLFPSAAISVDVGNGPGVLEVATFSVDVEGPGASVAVSNAHGTVTGVAGGVLLRPYARLISADGDSVTTYGEPWDMT